MEHRRVAHVIRRRHGLVDREALLFFNCLRVHEHRDGREVLLLPLHGVLRLLEGHRQRDLVLPADLVDDHVGIVDLMGAMHDPKEGPPVCSTGSSKPA